MGHSSSFRSSEYSADIIQQIFSYKPDEGLLYWRFRTPQFYESMNIDGWESFSPRFNGRWADKQVATFFVPPDTSVVKFTVTPKQPTITLSAPAIAWTCALGEFPDVHVGVVSSDWCDLRPHNIAAQSWYVRQVRRNAFSFLVGRLEVGGKLSVRVSITEGMRKTRVLKEIGPFADVFAAMHARDEALMSMGLWTEATLEQMLGTRSDVPRAN